MGRYYNTSAATPVDYMYRMNTPLMQAVIGTNDQYITQNLETAAQQGVLANSFGYTPQDTDMVKSLQQKYTDKVGEITNNILGDAANWRKQLDPIRKLKQDIQTDYATGDISAYASNYAKRKALFDDIDERVKEYNKSGGRDKDGNAIGLSPEAGLRYKQKFDSQFKGTKDKNDPSVTNIYQGGEVLNDMNIDSVLSKGLEDLKADSTTNWRTDIVGNSWYFDDVTQKDVQVTPERIRQIVMSRLDDRTWKYLADRQSLGLISGVYDEQTGQAIMPFKNVPDNVPTPEEASSIHTMEESLSKIKDPQTKKVLTDRLEAYKKYIETREKMQWNDGSNGTQRSYLADKMKGIEAQYSYKQHEEGHKLSTNTVKTFQVGEANENTRAANTLAQKEKNDLRNYKLAKNKEANTGEVTVTDSQNSDGTTTHSVVTKYPTLAAADAAMKNGLFVAPTNTDSTTNSGTPSNFMSGYRLNQSTKAPSNNKAPTTPVVNYPAVTKTGKNAVKTLNSVMTTATGKTVKKVSVEGVSESIKNLKAVANSLDNQLASINKQIESYSSSKDALNNIFVLGLKRKAKEIQETLLVTNSELNTNRFLYVNVEKAMLNDDPLVLGTDAGLSKTEKDIYIKNSADSGKSLRTELEKATAAFKQSEATPNFYAYNPYGNNDITTNKIDTKAYGKMMEARKKLDEYNTVYNKAFKLKENVYKNIRNSEMMATNTIEFDKNDSEDISKILLDNPTGLGILNVNGSDLSSTSIRNPVVIPNSVLSKPATFMKNFIVGNKDYKFTFAGDDNNLTTYIQDNNVKVIPISVGGSTKGGSGNGLIKVKFDDPTGGIPSNQVYYIPMTENVSQTIGKKYSNNVDASIKTIADDLLDPVSKSIMKQFNVANLQDYASFDDVQQFKISLPFDGDKIPANVVIGPDNSVSVAVIDKNGNYTIPLNRIDTEGNPTPEVAFQSVTDFIQNMKYRKMLLDQSRKLKQ